MTTATKTKERPILFSGPMVRAILDGKKTQTRRVVKWPKAAPDQDPDYPHEIVKNDWPEWHHNDGWGIVRERKLRCPYGRPGDTLWVRETWQQYQQGPGNRRAVVDTPFEGAPTIYAADSQDYEPPRWRPSIHMPRWASRLTLRITDVRVERLNEISIGDIEDEGVGEMIEDPDSIPGEAFARAEHAMIGGVSVGPDPVVHGFAALWDSINAKTYPWESDPWVWCVTFEPLPTPTER